MESPMILIVGLIQYFILSMIVGGIIFNISFQLKKHLIFSTISSIMVYLIRNLFLMVSIPIGLSTLINMLLTIFIFKYVFCRNTTASDSKWKTSFLASVLIFIITVTNEILTLQPTLNLLKTNIQSVLNNTTLHFQATMIQNLGLLMIMLIVYIVKKYIVDRRDVFIDN